MSYDDEDWFGDDCYGDDSYTLTLKQTLGAIAFIVAVIVLCGLVAAMTGCQGRIEVQSHRASVKHEESLGKWPNSYTVEVIEVDGREYVVARSGVEGGQSISICPKTTPKAEAE